MHGARSGGAFEDTGESREEDGDRSGAEPRNRLVDGPAPRSCDARLRWRAGLAPLRVLLRAVQIRAVQIRAVRIRAVRIREVEGGGSLGFEPRAQRAGEMAGKLRCTQHAREEPTLLVEELPMSSIAVRAALEMRPQLSSAQRVELVLDGEVEVHPRLVAR